MTSHQEAERTAAPLLGGEDESWAVQLGQAQGISSLPITTRRGGTKRTQPGSSQRRLWAQPGAQQFPPPSGQRCRAVRCRSPGAGCPEAAGSPWSCALLWAALLGQRCASDPAVPPTSAVRRLRRCSLPQRLPAGAQGHPPSHCVSRTHTRLRSPSLRVPSTPRAHRVPAASRPAVLRRPTEAIILLQPVVRHRAACGAGAALAGRAFTFFISGQVGGNPMSVFLGCWFCGFCFLGFFFFLPSLFIPVIILYGKF